MGYVFDTNDAVAYDRWLTGPRNRFSRMQSRMMLDMLNPSRGDTLLSIGCGTGTSLIPILEKGVAVTGLDPSTHMLDIARERLGPRADLHQGYAEDLPFDDNAFNFSCLITALEFVDDPHTALAEACRVTKDRLFVGFLNRYAIKGIQRRVSGIFRRSIYSHARFYSVWQVRKKIQALAGPVPVTYKTACLFPRATGRLSRHIEEIGVVQRCPFGEFAGLVATLVPRYRTKPMSLKVSPNRATGLAAG
jgi:ubiquinone/menaquinone biosynthesis C-methylase UbiE